MRNDTGAANISLIQSLYEAFGRGEISFIVAAAAPDIAWTVTGRHADYPLLGTRKGPKGVEDFFRQLAELQDVVEFSPREFYAVDERVFVLGHYAWTARKSGRAIDTDWVHVFTVRNGKVAAFREFTDTAQFAGAHKA